MTKELSFTGELPL